MDLRKPGFIIYARKIFRPARMFSLILADECYPHRSALSSLKIVHWLKEARILVPNATFGIEFCSIYLW